MSFLGVIRVTVLFNNINYVLLSAILQTQKLLLQIFELWHQFEHIFDDDIAFLRNFFI